MLACRWVKYAAEMNHQVACFIRDQLGIVDRGFVFDLVPIPRLTQNSLAGGGLADILSNQPPPPGLRVHERAAAQGQPQLDRPALPPLPLPHGTHSRGRLALGVCRSVAHTHQQWTWCVMLVPVGVERLRALRPAQSPRARQDRDHRQPCAQVDVRSLSRMC